MTENKDSLNNFKISIEKHFSNIKDPRREGSIKHKLFDIFFITICAVICGADNLKEVSEYAKTKTEWLNSTLGLQGKIPSYTTFWWIFALLDPIALRKSFVEWVSSMSNKKSGGIAIDGKAQKGTAEKNKPNSFVHIVSAWSSENNLTLSQFKVEGKSNEITAIPKLLDTIDVKNNVITIDAMGCQKDIAKKIIDKEGDYILALKGNQSKLNDEIENFFNQLKKYGDEGIDYHSFCSEETGHGRIEKRKVFVSKNLDFLPQKNDWANLQTAICIHCEKIIDNKKVEEDRYYISSLPPEPKNIGDFIRNHWGIENKVHWILDVAFREDDQKAKTGNIPENFSLLRRISLNYLKQDKKTKAGIKIKRKKAGWDNNYLLRILGVKSLS